MNGTQTVATARSSQSIQTGRSGTTDRTMDTFRTSMSTARVHTALAALAAEKQALMSKLQSIDAALETTEKKKVSKTRK